MKQVYFQNNGVIDAVAIATFGINAKESDNPIGYFGTGLKYAIAVLLRKGCDVIIHAGPDTFKFTKQRKIVRDKEFDIIWMNDVQLGFTTDLGKDWEIWQAFRELYCNALDENGFVTDSIINPAEDKTTVIVEGNDFHESYLKRHQVVLESDPMITNDYADIHAGNSGFVYYKGVRIYDGFARSDFTYNVHSGVEISEDRSAKYDFQLTKNIAAAIIQLTDKPLIESILLAKRGTFEHEQIDYGSSYGEPSDVFLEVAEGLRLNIKINYSVLNLLRRHKRLPKPERIPLTDVQELMLKRAIKFSTDIGYPVDAYPIITTSELKGGMQGLAESGTIYLSPDTFGFGTKYLAATLIEEYLHLHTGYGDMTRDLQNRLFNDIVSLGERILGEPV